MYGNIIINLQILPDPHVPVLASGVLHTVHEVRSCSTGTKYILFFFKKNTTVLNLNLVCIPVQYMGLQ
eukprot:SAG31_NODE_460_length_15364_cov_11.851294_12_plen_68_part_00